jgi:hypothetical protein
MSWVIDCMAASPFVLWLVIPTNVPPCRLPGVQVGVNGVLGSLATALNRR